jgi:hypothetical protein
MYTFKKQNGKRTNLTNMQMHFEYIFRFCNFDFYNVGETFKIQLFDKATFANDLKDCTAEFNANTMSSVLNQAINWIDENVKGCEGLCQG